MYIFFWNRTRYCKCAWYLLFPSENKANMSPTMQFSSPQPFCNRDCILFWSAGVALSLSNQNNFKVFMHHGIYFHTDFVFCVWAKWHSSGIHQSHFETMKRGKMHHFPLFSVTDIVPHSSYSTLISLLELGWIDSKEFRSKCIYFHHITRYLLDTNKVQLSMSQTQRDEVWMQSWMSAVFCCLTVRARRCLSTQFVAILWCWRLFALHASMENGANHLVASILFSFLLPVNYFVWSLTLGAHKPHCLTLQVKMHVIHLTFLWFTGCSIHSCSLNIRPLQNTVFHPLMKMLLNILNEKTFKLIVVEWRNSGPLFNLYMIPLMAQCHG